MSESDDNFRAQVTDFGRLVGAHERLVAGLQEAAKEKHARASVISLS